MTDGAAMIVCAVADDTRLTDESARRGHRNVHPRGDAERFVEEVRGDDSELARHLRIEWRELDGSSTTN